MNPKEYLRRYARRLAPNADGGFTATIQEFPGLVAEGETADEAVRNLESAAESWIDATLQTGHEVPPPVELSDYSGKFALRLPRGVHKRAAEMANIEGVSLNQWLVSAIAFYLGVGEALRVTCDSVVNRVQLWKPVVNNNLMILNWTTNVFPQSEEGANPFGGPQLYGANIGPITKLWHGPDAGALSWPKQHNIPLLIKN